MGRGRGRRPAHLSANSEKTLDMLSTLSIQNDENGRQHLEELKRHIRILCVEILDANMKFSKQMKHINMVIDDLKITFPKIFARGTKAQLQKRIELVHRYLRRNHANRRHRAKLLYRNEMESDSSDDVDSQEEPIRRPNNKGGAHFSQITPTPTPSKKGKVARNIKREDSEEYLHSKSSTQSSTTTIDDARIARLRSLRSSQPPTSGNATTTTTTTSSSTLNAFRTNTNSASGPSTPRTRPRATTVFPQTHLISSPSTLSFSPIRTNASEIAEVRKFLTTCDPPMTHLLSRFLAFGCRNAVFLGAVARFPEGRISEFVDKLSNHGSLDGERDLSGMEKMVLKLRFVEYKNRMSET